MPRECCLVPPEVLKMAVLTCLQPSWSKASCLRCAGDTFIIRPQQGDVFPPPLTSPLRIQISGHPAATVTRVPTSSPVSYINSMVILIKCVPTNIIFWSSGKAVISRGWWYLNSNYENSTHQSSVFMQRVANKRPPGIRYCEAEGHKHTVWRWQ